MSILSHGRVLGQNARSTVQKSKINQPHSLTHTHSSFLNPTPPQQIPIAPSPPTPPTSNLASVSNPIPTPCQQSNPFHFKQHAWPKWSSFQFHSPTSPYQFQHPRYIWFVQCESRILLKFAWNWTLKLCWWNNPHIWFNTSLPSPTTSILPIPTPIPSIRQQDQQLQL